MSQTTLPQDDLEELASPLIALLDEYQDLFIGWMKIHQLLLDGKPVSPDRIAVHLGLPQEEVAELLRGAELDQEGNLVGVGLSIVPLPTPIAFTAGSSTPGARGMRSHSPFSIKPASRSSLLTRSAAKRSASPARQRGCGTWNRSPRSSPGFPERRRISRRSGPFTVTISISSPRLKRHLSMPLGTRRWSSSRSTRCSESASCCGKGSLTSR